MTTQNRRAAALELVAEAIKEKSWLRIDLPAEVVDVVRGNWSASKHDEGFDVSAILLLADGQFAAFEGGASCDTGWTCQASAYVTIHPTAEDAWLNGLGTDSRAFVERGEAACAN